MAYKRIRPIPITEGGTNATSLTNTDGVVYYDGTKLNTTTVGTAAQVLTSNGPGLAPTFQAASGGGITTLSTDGGTTATGSTVNLQVACVDPDFLTANDGTAKFYASTDTVTLQFESVTPGDEQSLTNIGIGINTLQTVTTNGGSNIAIGSNTAPAVTIGQSNIAIGMNSATLLDEGSSNIFIGDGCCTAATAPISNILIGALSGGGLTTGTNGVGIGDRVSVGESGDGNVVIGSNAGANIATTDSYNIFIGNRNAPAGGVSGAIKIAAFDGSNVLATTSCTIAGIFGATVTGSAVLCSSSGLLGTVVSSERFKQNIRPLSDSLSEKIYQLQPKTFNLKRKPDEFAWGLIAEEVNEILPDLVVKDEDGKPFSVKYHELPVLLLQEIKKLRAEINALKGR